MRTNVIAIALLTAVSAPQMASAAAQEPAPNRSLADLHRSFQERRLKIMRTEGMSVKKHRELMGELAGELQSFLSHEAKGDEKHEGRLMLTDAYMNLGEEDKARATLKAFDAAQAPALLLVEAARVAGNIGLTDQRGQWIEAAIAKPASFEERMTVGMHLMTALQEIELGEQIFDKALEAATDDEARAKVGWYRAHATREREDLAEGAYDEALEALAKEFPATHWGGIAADRIKARGFEMGADAVPLTLQDHSGKQVKISDYAGKVLLLCFWASWRTEIAPTLLELHQDLHARGFDILGISLDAERAAFDGALAEHEFPWRNCFDGKGWETEAALRYDVEAVPHLVLIGRDGKIAGLNLLPTDDARRKVMIETIEKALAAPAPDKR